MDVTSRARSRRWGSISGRGLIDLTLVAFEFGRHASPGPLMGVNVVAAAVSRWGTDDQKADLLPGILSGETVAAWALAEPQPNDRLGMIACTASRSGPDYTLRGTKTSVEAGGQAHQLLLTARTSEGVANFLVPRDAPGVTVTPMSSLDVTRRYSSVELDDVRVPERACLGGPEVGEMQTEALLEVAVVVQLAEIVGAMDRCLDMTVEWAFNRYSFGRPLASYQELKHRFADMKAWLEAGYAISARAAEACRTMTNGPASG